MPDFLRSLIVIVGLATFVFAVAKSPACVSAISAADFKRRRNLWFFITIEVFLSHNFWVYITAAAAAIIWTASREKDRFAMYLFLLFAVPGIPKMIEIPGAGNIFVIEYYRLLALTLLLPAFLFLRKQNGITPFGRLPSDKFLAAYLVFQFLLIADGASMGEILRHGFFYPFLGAFLPYYVASRSPRTLEGFRDLSMSFVVAAMVLSAIGAFEFVKRWLLYTPLESVFGISWSLGNYLMRGDALRAVGTAGQSIPLGYAIMVAIGFFLYLRLAVPDAKKWRPGLLLLAVGLISPLSRGPWIGAAAMITVYVLTGPEPIARLTRLAATAVVLFPLAMLTPAIDYLPWVGTVDEHNVDYRKALFAQSIAVILKNPLFGSSNYMETEEMKSLAIGNGGYTDIVSTYVGIGLAQGLVGLFFFAGVFATAIYGAARSMLRIDDHADERRLLGRVLLSVLIAILIVIGTVSSITIIPTIYWAVAGLAVAYIQMLANEGLHRKIPIQTGNETTESAGISVSPRLRGQKYVTGPRARNTR